MTKRAEVGVGIGITKAVFGIINSLLTNGLVAKKKIYFTLFCNMFYCLFCKLQVEYILNIMNFGA